MDYLFFDIECSDGRHICEFGYVLANERFEVIKRENLLINPKTYFNLTGRKDGRDLYLNHSYDEYYASPEFPFYYEKIKGVLQRENQYVVGFSTPNDAHFLEIACERYNLPQIDFPFYDVQAAFEKFYDVFSSLEAAAEQLSVTLSDKMHESSEDAYFTMELFKALCKAQNLTVEQLLEVSRSQYFGKDFAKKLAYFAEHYDSFGKNKRKKLVDEFLARAEVSREVASSPIAGKKVCFSVKFYRKANSQFIVLLQEIINCGASITSKASSADYFIRHDSDDEENPDVGFSHALKKQKTGNLEVVTLPTFQQLSGLSDEVLSALPFPTAGEHKAPQEKERVHATLNLGDLLRDKGII